MIGRGFLTCAIRFHRYSQPRHPRDRESVARALESTEGLECSASRVPRSGLDVCSKRRLLMMRRILGLSVVAAALCVASSAYAAQGVNLSWTACAGEGTGANNK